MQENIALKQALAADVQILLSRFESYQLDQEERSWHMQRYVQNLNPDAQILTELEEIIQSQIRQLLPTDLSEMDADTRYKQAALQHMSQVFQRLRA